MNWYKSLLDTPVNESPLELEWRNLTKRIHLFQKRFDMAKNHYKAYPNENEKNIVDDLYWEIEEMKGKKRQVEEKLRNKKE